MDSGEYAQWSTSDIRSLCFIQQGGVLEGVCSRFETFWPKNLARYDTIRPTYLLTYKCTPN